MKPLSFLSRTVTCFAILASTVAFPLASSAHANDSDKARALIDDVVQLIDSQYHYGQSRRVDISSADWERQRHRLLTQTYADEAEARVEIARALEHLEDPYTYLLSPSDMNAMRDSVSGHAADIGIRLVLGSQGAPTVSAPPMLGSPAFYAGVMQGDLILAVNGRSSETWSAGKTIRQIQGRENSSVNLTLMRNDRQIDVQLVRANLALPSVGYAMHGYRDETGVERQVGYIRLARFDDRAAEDMKAAIADLESQSVDGYVLDLRSNPGGLLEAGTQIAELFLDGGTIVTVHDRDRVRRIVDRRAPLTDKPLSLLVDGGSASSSEILAGALRDAERATLVGTRTFGKGVVQTLYVLPDDSCLAISTASYRTPNGDNLHQSGLRPDVTVPITRSDLALLEQAEGVSSANDPQYTAAVASLFELPIRPAGPEHPGIIERGPASIVQWGAASETLDQNLELKEMATTAPVSVTSPETAPN